MTIFGSRWYSFHYHYHYIAMLMLLGSVLITHYNCVLEIYVALLFSIHFNADWLKCTVILCKVSVYLHIRIISIYLHIRIISVNLHLRIVQYGYSFPGQICISLLYKKTKVTTRQTLNKSFTLFVTILLKTHETTQKTFRISFHRLITSSIK